MHVTNNIVSILKFYPLQRIIIINDNSTLEDWENRLYAGIRSHGYNPEKITTHQAPRNFSGKGEISLIYIFFKISILIRQLS